MESLETLHARILACRLCEDAGVIERAAPVVWGRAGDRLMLIGQAPGITELEIRRPFQGRAGRELFRWLASVGIAEDEFRSNVYMTAVTKCFPGRTPSGSGDRRPSGREIALCRPYLEAQLRLIQPEAILLIGGLAIERYFPKRRLSELIGEQFDRDGVAIVPLPHPSGASRWLNVPAHRDLLARALQHVRVQWERCVLPSLPRAEPAPIAG
ncbi:MAG TPA: uracil-DNA glycosylase family protein [Chloroflexota bacterium]